MPISSSETLSLGRLQPAGLAFEIPHSLSLGIEYANDGNDPYAETSNYGSPPTSRHYRPEDERRIFPIGYMWHDAALLQRARGLVDELMQCIARLEGNALGDLWNGNATPEPAMNMHSWVTERIDAAEQIADLGERLVQLKRDRIAFDQLCPGPSQGIATNDGWIPFRRLNSQIDLVESQLKYTSYRGEHAPPVRVAAAPLASHNVVGDAYRWEEIERVHAATIQRGFLAAAIAADRFNNALIGLDTVNFEAALIALAEYLEFLQSKGLTSMDIACFCPKPKNVSAMRTLATPIALKRELRRKTPYSEMRTFIDGTLAPIFER